MAASSTTCFGRASLTANEGRNGGTNGADDDDDAAEGDDAGDSISGSARGQSHRTSGRDPPKKCALNHGGCKILQQTSNGKLKRLPMCKHLQSHACFAGDVAARSRSEEVIKGSQTHKGETPSARSRGSEW